MYQKRKPNRRRPENNKATVKVEQNFKIQTGLQDFGPDLRCVSEGSVHFLPRYIKIENGLKNDYTDDKIEEAVIKAINLALSLRSYLEDKADLALAKLRRIMRWHFQERTSTELYDQLNSTVQQPKKKPQEFLIRVLDLEQKKSCLHLKKVIRNRKTILF